MERGQGDGAPTLREAAEALKAEDDARLRRTPLVEAAFAAFPGAELVEEDTVPPAGGGNWSKRA